MSVSDSLLPVSAGGIVVAPTVYVPFSDLIDLAADDVGGVVLDASDDFFAEKENLLKAEAPIFVRDRYTDHGKWMDGWESRCKREVGYDWCIVKLGMPGIVRGVNVDTAFFLGNFPEYCSIDGASMAPHNKLAAGMVWHEILPKTKLRGAAQNLMSIHSNDRWTHLRLNIFPDGGVARLRVHGEVVPNWSELARSNATIDLVAAQNGGSVIGCNDSFFGPRDNLIKPGRAKTMGGGWETRRRRGAGSDWIVMRTGRSGCIEAIEIDTHHYRGNFPDSCTVEGLTWPARDLIECDLRDRPDLKWQVLLPRQKLRASQAVVFKKELSSGTKAVVFDYLRLNIFPDGGISRFKAMGRVKPGSIKLGSVKPSRLK